MVASPDGFWLILSIPIKDVSAQFEVTKAYTFPTKVANGTCGVSFGKSIFSPYPGT
jgi:hypothetical protein